jgi:hypothetical protein
LIRDAHAEEHPFNPVVPANRPKNRSAAMCSIVLPRVCGTMGYTARAAIDVEAARASLSGAVRASP